MDVDCESDLVVLLISKNMGATAMGEYTEEMFKKGCNDLGCDSMDAWKKSVRNVLRPSLNDKAKFTELYNWVHVFGADLGKRNLDIDVACALWDMFLGSKCGFMK